MKKNIKLQLLVCLYFFNTGIGFGQSAGDIAFIAFNSDGDDDFAIVALEELPDTTFHFTDRNWLGSSFDTGEGTLFWDTEGTIAQGTVVVFSDVDSDANPGFGVSTGSLTDTGSLNLSVSGDAIWAFVTNSIDDTTFVSAITNEDDEFANIAGTGLTAGTNAFDLSDGAGTPDGGIYTGTRIHSSFSNFRSLIYDFSNWAEDNDDGEVFLPFDATSFALSSSVTIDGDAGWRMLSLPVTGGTVEEISDDTPVQGIEGGSDSNFDSNFFLNPASDGSGTDGWTEPSNAAASWGDGLGFILFFFDNELNGSTELPVTLDADGTEPGSDVTISLSDTYTLAGNPFASNIELDEITGNDSGVGVNDGLVSPISVWDDGAGTDNTGSWVTYNFGEGNEIAAWQGFFIQRNSSATTSLTIPVLSKTDSSAEASIFTKKVLPEIRSVEISLEGAGFTDKSSRLYFTKTSRTERDAFDGAKLNPLNEAPYISFVQDFGKGAELLVQDARPLNPEFTQEYKLDFNSRGINGGFKLSWSGWRNIPTNWEFTFRDEEEGKEINMKAFDEYEFHTRGNQKVPTESISLTPGVKAKPSGNKPRFIITVVPGTSSNNEPDLNPARFALDQNYPNPFNPSTVIRYHLPVSSEVKLEVFNIMGEKITTLYNGKKSPGTYRAVWNAEGVASGIYYYRLTAGNEVLIRKMTLIK